MPAKNSLDLIQSTITTLEQRRETLQSRLGSAVTAAQNAARAAIDYLVIGEDEPARSAELEEEAREQRRAADRLSLALTEIDSRLEIARLDLRSARDDEARRARAAEIEREVKKIEAHATTVVARIKAVDSAAAALATAFMKLLDALPADFSMPMMRRDPHNFHSPETAASSDIARALVASSLAGRAPEIFEPIERVEGFVAPDYERRALLLQHIDPRDERLQYMIVESADPATLPARIETAIVDHLRGQAAALRGESAKLSSAA